jgi:hypothetical protein
MAGDDFSADLIRYPTQLLPDEVEIKRLLGKIDVVSEKNQRETLMRVFEAVLGGKKAWLKEFLPASASLAKRELSTTRGVIRMHNKLIAQEAEDGGGVYTAAPLPVPLVLGSLRTDDRIEDPAFQALWRRNFPRAQPPQAGNIWLVYSWDKSSFKSIRSFPALPQVVDSSDYFLPAKRSAKRWRFIRMAIFRTLEACDFLHRSGVAHNSLNSDSLWMTTRRESELHELRIIITDLGASLRLKQDLGPNRKNALFEDFYALGFIFLELILASFCDDAKGAEVARAMVAQAAMKDANIGRRGSVPEAALAFKADKALTEKELRNIFETNCDSDFKQLRAFFRGIAAYKQACVVLDQDSNGAWKLIFRLLSRGSLVDERGAPLSFSGRRFIRDSAALFADLLD